ncbi:DHA2 family efflux MFS transporter permease subunit [Pseudooceanicola spongiae]|uniref:DHA2 family efflux MFS transporter permease subunit n=1 Tax=Pseudooceanicola spongiae TaxID=2613965 RepID=A0A7L9WR79_9RHOB|nr:DHA2 family efflux MFS transporter permease subunit [Pseudooceanicola spongiae]QOL82789.1 DHA2 family efflux MFS transporter permease subunit [Pseudooceanicola spongiae]
MSSDLLLTSASPPRARAQIALLLGGFITIFDLFVVNVAIPAIRTDLNASLSDIAFVVAGYELSFGVLLIAGSRLGDRYGRRKVFMLGMLGFTLASILCGLATSASMLILARLVQGAAAGMLFPQVYTMLRVLYDENGRRRAFGFLGMTLGFAAIAGQVLGGWIVTADFAGLGWRSVFLINLPVGVIGLACAATIVETFSEDGSRIDKLGTLLASGTLLLVLFPLLEGAKFGWPLWIWACFMAAILLAVLFVAWERKLRESGGAPAVDLELFSNPAFSAGSLVVLLVYSTSTSFFLCFALLVQTGFGLSAFDAGTLFAPASVAFVAASLIAPRLVAKFGDRLLAVGALIYALGTGWVIAIAVSLTSADEAHRLLPALILFGFGQGLSMTPLLNFVSGLVPARQAGMAGGIISTMQQIGGAFGVALVSILFGELLGGGEALAYTAAFAGALAYNIVALVIVAGVLISLARRAN